MTTIVTTGIGGGSGSDAGGHAGVSATIPGGVLILALVYSSTGVPSNSIRDDRGNAYTRVSSSFVMYAGGYIALYYASTVPGSPVTSVYYTTSNGEFAEIYVATVAPVMIFDSAVTAAAGGASPLTVISGTPVASGELLVAGIAVYLGSVTSVASPWSIVGQKSYNGVGIGICAMVEDPLVAMPQHFVAATSGGSYATAIVAGFRLWQVNKAQALIIS